MRYLPLLALAVIFASCEKEAEPIAYTILKGTVAGDLEQISIKGTDGWEDIKLDSSRTFSDTFDITGPTYAALYTGEMNTGIYLEPGDVVTVAIGDSSNAAPVYSGANGDINNYLYKKSLIDRDFNEDFRGLFSLDEADFLHRVDSTKMEMQKLLDVIPATSGFHKLESRNLALFDKLNAAQYETYHDYMTEDDYAPTEKITSRYADFDLDNEEDAKLFGSFQSLASTILDKKVEAMDSSMNYIDRNLKVLEGIESPTIIHNQLQNALYFFSPDNENLEADRDSMLAVAKLQKTKDLITERYDIISKLVPGSPSPEFEYENYKGGKTKLADLRGKYVYIDVWATWCGPCIGEIPSLKALEKEYHDANIEFVSISIDKEENYEKWRNMIENRELEGVQLIADNAWESDFVTNYGIRGIPRFILVDPEGKIVSSDAPRPSTPEIKEKFEELGL